MLLTHIAGESLPHSFGDLPPYEAHHGERSSGKVSVDRMRWCRCIDFYSLYFVSYAVNKRGKIIHEAINSIVKCFEATYLDPTPCLFLMKLCKCYSTQMEYIRSQHDDSHMPAGYLSGKCEA